MTYPYKGYEIKLISHKLKSGLWSPYAVVSYDYGSKITFTQIHSRGPRGFKTRREADGCALALAKVWIDHKTR